MPISIQCNCGKSLRVKEDFAGKKVRCPGCKAVLSVPEPEVSAEDDALNALLFDEPTPSPAATPDTSFQEEEKPRVFPKPSSPPNPVTLDHEPRSRKKKRLDPMSREDREQARQTATGPGLVVNGSIITGLLMMLGAVVWFFGALSLGWIFYYPPILFVMGIVTVLRGFRGEEE